MTSSSADPGDTAAAAAAPQPPTTASTSTSTAAHSTAASADHNNSVQTQSATDAQASGLENSDAAAPAELEPSSHAPPASATRPVTPPTNGSDNPDDQNAAQPSSFQTPVAATSQDHPMTDAPVATPTNNNNNSSSKPNQLQSPAIVTAGTQQQQQQQQNLSQPSQDVNVANASEQFMPSTPFTPANGQLDQHAYMMMALAMSGAGNGMSPPPTVTPSQVTLPNPMDAASFNGLGSANATRQAGPDKALESFARIEFADSVFQMTTYAVIIGRDQRALEQARRDEKRAEVHKRLAEENASKGLPPPSPINHDRSKFSKSYVSEEGGMLGPESDSDESGRPAKRRKTSTAGSSQQDNDESQENIISNRQYVSHTPGAAAVDLTSLRPSPWHVPFIGIHSPGPNIASKTKAISREHLKIAYNQDEGVFEAIPLHKNGFFCDDVHYKSDKVVLKCGDRLQIKDIDFRFMINGVEKGRTGAEDEEEKTASRQRQTHGGKEMSFEFEQTHGNGQIVDTSDELSELEGSPGELSDLGADEDDEDGDEEGGDGDSEIKTEIVIDPVTGLPLIPKKRGPGRPPKNGIMSKREQRLLKKQQQEMAKKTLPQAPPMEPPIKRKVGRPRKHPLPENAGDKPEKRKYKPRKPKEDGAEGSDAERRAREKKEKKARPKSPPLELKIEDYTEEQLQKPNKNYGVLIDETLTAAGPDGLTLKQIYKRICQRYPWFYFHTETKGWESSVRHNLIGNEAFKKDETTNLWSRVPGVELDAGKKRKASSPDRNLAAQGYGAYYGYGAQQQHMVPGAPGYPPGQVPPGYQMPAYAQQQQQGQAQQPRPAQQFAGAPGQMPPPAAAQPPAAAAAAPGAAQVPGYIPPPAPARPQLGAPPPGSYSSPYASRPPPPAPVKTEDGAAPAAGQPGQPAHIAAAGVRPSPGVAPAAHSASPANRPSATPPVTAPSRPVIDPRLLTAVVGLKNGLVENLSKARNPKAEAIVMSALNRCVGLKTEATENDRMETICIKGIRQVIDGFIKNKSPTPGSATASTEPPPIFEPKVLASLNGFKDVSIRALKARLGEAKAEAVTLSAIDRVLGFADASILPPAAEGETPGNFEGVEQHLIKSIRQLLLGMNQKLQESTAAT